MTSLMFACSQCGIAYFYNAKDLQSHYRECRSVNDLRKQVTSLQEEMTEQRLLLGNVSTNVQTALDNLVSFQQQVMVMMKQLSETVTHARGGKRRRVKGGEEDEEGSAVPSMYSRVSLSLDMQLAHALAYFRKRKIPLPVSEEKVEEVENLLNEVFPSPAISFTEFHQMVREDVPLIRSLFSEFMQLLDQHRNQNHSADEEKSVDHHHHLELQHASLDSAGGAHQLLLSKFLQFFHNGFATHRMNFPVLIFHLGHRKILKFTERLFGSASSSSVSSAKEPKQKRNKRKIEEWMESISQKVHVEQEEAEPEEEAELEEEEVEENEQEDIYQDVDNIACFPFFVFVDKETGWKIMKYTDHVYPLFLLIQSTVLYRGMTDSHVMMSQEETKIAEVVSSFGDRKKDNNRQLAITKRLEASYEEQSQIVSKLSTTVVNFMAMFRQKYFEEFLQILYDSYSVDVSQMVQWLQLTDINPLKEEENDQNARELSTTIHEEEKSNSKSSSPVISVRSANSKSSSNIVASRRIVHRKQTKTVYVYNGDEEELSIDDYS